MPAKPKPLTQSFFPFVVELVKHAESCADKYGPDPVVMRAAQAIDELARALFLVARGIRSGHIEDQTLIGTDEPEAPMATLTPLSQIISAALKTAGA